LLKNLKEFRHIRMKPGMALVVPAYWSHTVSAPHTKMDGSPNPLSAALSMKDTKDLLPFKFGIDHVKITDKLQQLLGKVTQKMRLSDDARPAFARFIAEAMISAYLKDVNKPRMISLLDTLGNRMKAITPQFEVSPGPAMECEALRLPEKHLKSSMKLYKALQKTAKKTWQNIDLPGVAEIQIIKNIEFTTYSILSPWGSDLSKAGDKIHRLLAAYTGECTKPIYDWEWDEGGRAASEPDAHPEL